MHVSVCLSARTHMMYSGDTYARTHAHTRTHMHTHEYWAPLIIVVGQHVTAQASQERETAW